MAKYYVVAFDMQKAFVSTEKDLSSGSIDGFWVEYNKLRYKYIDINATARMIAHNEKNAPDPRKILDEDISLEDILALPEYAGRKREDVLISVRFLRNAPHVIQEERIRKYDYCQTKTEDELFSEQKAALEKKKEYTPRAGKMEMCSPLLDSGLIPAESRLFPSLDEAMASLYMGWKQAGNIITPGLNPKTGIDPKMQERQLAMLKAIE